MSILDACICHAKAASEGPLCPQRHLRPVKLVCERVILFGLNQAAQVQLAVCNGGVCQSRVSHGHPVNTKLTMICLANMERPMCHVLTTPLCRADLYL